MPSLPSSASSASSSAAALRRQASTRLGGPVAGNALAVLHALALSPDTAADALALLHELQVHQVELEMQAEELRESRLALEAQLRRHVALYEGLPAGCLTLALDLLVLELNPRAAALLGLVDAQASALSLDGLLDASSASALRTALATLPPGASTTLTALRLQPVGGPARQVRADIAAEPDTQQFLVVLTPAS